MSEETVDIREARRRRKLTQAALAEQIHVGNTTIAMWETGLRVPGLRRARQVAHVLGLKLDLLRFPGETGGTVA